MQKFKTEILTVAGFVEARPDMEIHTDKSIQAAIFSAAGLLNSECNNLINDVWEYNSGVDPLPNHPLYRNAYELDQLKEAFVVQTQYTLNLGNDWAIGGGSYSIGNVNTSFNRPENRPELAPGVKKLLQNARVYQLVDFGTFGLKERVKTAQEEPSVRAWAEAAFVKQYQPDADPGNIAYIGQNQVVSFGKPQDLNITTYNTQHIAGGIGYEQQYFKIDEVPNIAFFGNDNYGAYSAIHRGELDAMGLNPINLKKVWDPIDQIYKWINEYKPEYFGALTAKQTYDAIYAAGLSWNPNLNYRIDYICRHVTTQNFLKWYKAKRDNIGQNPEFSPDDWEELQVEHIDIQAVIDQLKPYIDQEMQNQLDVALEQRKHNFVQESPEQVFIFENEADWNQYNQDNGLTVADWEDVVVPGLPQDIAFTTANNNFTGSQQTFNNLTSLQAWSNQNQPYIATNQADIATKKYVDDRINTFIPGNQPLKWIRWILDNPTPTSEFSVDLSIPWWPLYFSYSYKNQTFKPASSWRKGFGKYKWLIQLPEIIDANYRIILFLIYYEQ